MESENIPTEPNGDFEIDLVQLDELARDQPDNNPNGDLAASEGTGLRSFNARTQTVQWGKYDGEEAVLLVFALSFVYEDRGSRRMTQAHIRVGFEEVTNPPQQKLNLRNAPIVRHIRPMRWERYAHKEGKPSILLKLDPEVTVAGVTARLGSIETEVKRTDRQYSVRMQANPASSPGQKFHVDEATWTVSSTGTKDVGIVRDFKIATVVVAPRDPANPFCAYMFIEASIGTGVAGMFRSKLTSKIERPVFLDRKTPKPINKPCSYEAVGQDFNDENFPWQDLGLIPTEEVNVDVLNV